jgi:lysophospholipase L1-like esterase
MTTAPRRSLRCLAALLLAAAPALAADATASAPAPAPASGAADFLVHDGDTPVVFLGDSITEQRMYTTLVEAYVTTRYAARKTSFRNAGWSGDKAYMPLRGFKFEDSLKRDVLNLQPKLVTIAYGMNDAREGDGGIAKYIDYETRTVEALKKAGARVVLVTSTPEERFEKDQPGGSQFNTMLKKYADALKTVATKEDVPFIDQYTPFVQAIEDGRKAGVLSAEPNANPMSRLIAIDGVHPDLGGHLLMATNILRNLGGSDLVSSAHLDAATGKTIDAKGCAILWQDAPGVGSLQFTRTDDVLPWPVPDDQRIALALKLPNFDPATWLNRYLIQVANLPAGSYRIAIDDTDVATATAADLAAGINLGFNHKGPIGAQCQKLYQAIVAKNEAYYTRWRGVQLARIEKWMAAVPGVEEARTAEEARLDKVIADDEATIASLAKPAPHVWKIIPAK